MSVPQLISNKKTWKVKLNTKQKRQGTIKIKQEVKTVAQ